jgi:hypothetical protein
MKGDVRVNTEPRQLYDSVTDMSKSQVRVRHVFVLTADRRTDLVGCPLLYVHPTISMTLCKMLQVILVDSIVGPTTSSMCIIPLFCGCFPMSQLM